ncbi:methyltransferase, FkbM family [Prosthecobacter debontii]|uniref:Methyltransferase, FkbM family n=1 Tax=Prosthecobacter debontii TaxID=48467 RepID=A0A1T4YW94_9BACT|nr:FkbM family methyltransferase [Prosthecobacter debontii]SKB06052.1 methyltransferase, FkbM family [Prosthecobacter debontii]
MLNHLKQLHKVWTSPGNRQARTSAVVRSVKWFISKRWSDQKIIRPIFGDRQFIFYKDGFVANSLMLFSEWSEYDSLKLIDTFLRPEDSFLDVGANVGLFTILASRHVKDGLIVCVEPGRVQRERLMEHLQLNHIKAEVFPYAVGNEEKTVSFNIGDAVAHIALQQATDSPKMEMVDIKKLDTFLPRRKYSLMKLDVEGFELAALEGASGFLSEGLFPVILFELNGSSDRYGIAPEQIVTFLTKQGYTLGVYRHDSGTFDTTAKLWEDVLAVNSEGLQMLRDRIPHLKII